MSVSVEGPRGGRRKPVDGDLNLVPYIDLLTCMIAFLLITAVWTQLARLEVQQKGQGETGEGVEDPVKIAVIVHDDGFSLVVGEEQRPLPRKGRDYDYQRLGVELHALKQAHPDKSDLRIHSGDAVRFESLVGTMDVAMAAGFPSVSLLDASTAL